MEELVNHKFTKLDFVDFLERSFDDYTINRYVRGYIPAVIAFLLSKPFKAVVLPVECLNWNDLVIYIYDIDKEFGSQLSSFLLRYEMLSYTVNKRFDC